MTLDPVSYTHLDVYKRQVQRIIERHINGYSNYTNEATIVRVKIIKLNRILQPVNR